MDGWLPCIPYKTYFVRIQSGGPWILSAVPFRLSIELTHVGDVRIEVKIVVHFPPEKQKRTHVDRASSIRIAYSFSTESFEGP